jgi:hypothetical protein
MPQSSNYNYISQDLIQDGYPPRAVRIIINKSGTATIERDAEIVLAAKEVGLAQLPVLFVYEGNQ